MRYVVGWGAEVITWAEAAGKASLSRFLKVDRKMETAEWVVKTKSCWEALTQDVDAEGTGRSRFSLQATCKTKVSCMHILWRKDISLKVLGKCMYFLEFVS